MFDLDLLKVVLLEYWNLFASAMTQFVGMKSALSLIHYFIGHC